MASAQAWHVRTSFWQGITKAPKKPGLFTVNRRAAWIELSGRASALWNAESPDTRVGTRQGCQNLRRRADPAGYMVTGHRNQSRRLGFPSVHVVRIGEHDGHNNTRRQFLAGDENSANAQDRATEGSFPYKRSLEGKGASQTARALSQHRACRPPAQLQKFWALRSDHQADAGVPKPTRKCADYHSRIPR